MKDAIESCLTMSWNSMSFSVKNVKDVRFNATDVNKLFLAMR
jgi:hypothetical protein